VEDLEKLIAIANLVGTLLHTTPTLPPDPIITKEIHIF
jgi:hypothetical protein